MKAKTPVAVSCKLSRWQLIKRQLRNLHLYDFLEKVAHVEKPILLDVRTPEEYAQGHLPEAINLDYLGADFIDSLEKLPKDATYFVYCRSCRRSTRVCVNLLHTGFSEVFNLDGGLCSYPDMLTKVIIST